MDRSAHKKLSIKITFILLCFTSQLFAQETFWKKITPDQVSLQYAGSIGFLSAGAGYDLFQEKASLSFHIGYVPENLGGELTILAAKFQYKPWAIKIKDKFVIYPFNPVIFPSYTLGQNFDFNFKRSTYRKGYYFWSSALRVHMGASLEAKILATPTMKIKSFSIFTEVNTNDLYAISWFQNRNTTRFTDIFRLGYGVRMAF